ncbi:hypothetical protein DICVIV_09544 [Dictyocaulus viviparus]|uniref:Trafficking protein particle complex subunit 13 C-terminal domain-containing protein n=1 Tax=Dictyocaulus viviparus TaxID=29172 RepID=A0A0D8XID5_DICVI|nr:hypothetical protein DICVIV_09544 [Dictyocaulus viviparus]
MQTGPVAHERSLDLRLELQSNSKSLVFCSVSGVSLGQIPPNGSVTFSVEIFPVSIGLQESSCGFDNLLPVADVR